MEKRIKERFTPAMLEEALEAFEAERESVQELDGFESFIYEYKSKGRDYILRIGHSNRRSPDLIRGEVDWINYLAEGGVGAARAVTSSRGELVEEIDDRQGEKFLATAFEKAPGGGPDWLNMSDAFIEHYGQQLGRMHRLSADYEPANPAWKRLEWDDRVNLDLEAWMPESEEAVMAKFKELMAYLETLSKGKEDYGLIHQDAHCGNLFVDEKGQITLFDFDDSVYGWYAYDVAMVLFYAVVGREEPEEFTARFMPLFLKGYRSEYPIEARWLVEVPHFLKLREIDLYAVIQRDFDMDNLDPWCAMYMDGRKERIEKGLPFLEFDFTALD